MESPTMYQSVFKFGIAVVFIVSAWVDNSSLVSNTLIEMNVVKKPTMRMAFVGKYTDPFKEENIQEHFHAVNSEQYTGTYQLSIQTVF